MRELPLDEKCPECKEKTVWLDWGEPQSFNEPEDAPSVYCRECGWSDVAFRYDKLYARHPILKGYVFGFNDLAKEILSEDILPENALSEIRMALYRHTNSGIGFGDSPYSVSCVPYAEGFDGELEPVILAYPFKMDAFWKAVEKADKVGKHVWTCINEQDDDCECYLLA